MEKGGRDSFVEILPKHQPKDEGKTMLKIEKRRGRTGKARQVKEEKEKTKQIEKHAKNTHAHKSARRKGRKEGSWREGKLENMLNFQKTQEVEERKNVEIFTKTGEKAAEEN